MKGKKRKESLAKGKRPEKKKKVKTRLYRQRELPRKHGTLAKRESIRGGRAARSNAPKTTHHKKHPQQG